MKNPVEFPGVLASSRQFSVRCNTILWSFWGKTLFYLEFPGVKYKPKSSRGVFKKVRTQPCPCLVFFLE